MKKDTSTRFVQLKKAGKLFLWDLYTIRYALVWFMVYWIVSRLLFHHFCPMVIITGFPCPGCGMTRALLHLLSGEFLEVWRYHPAVYAWILYGIQLVWRRYVRQEKQMKQTGILIAVFSLTILCYIWRMFTVFPHTPPMCYEWDNLLAKRLPLYQELVKRIFFQ